MTKANWLGLSWFFACLLVLAGLCSIAGGIYPLDIQILLTVAYLSFDFGWRTRDSKEP